MVRIFLTQISSGQIDVHDEFHALLVSGVLTLPDGDHKSGISARRKPAGHTA